MGEPTPYAVGGVDVATGSALTVQVPPRVFLGRMTGLLFDTDKTFLLPRSLAGIRGLRRFYAQHPGVQVLVVGHTDTVGAAQYNLTLSIERANAIAAYLEDDVDAWMEFYPGRTGSAHWGTVEDQHMLKELGFYAGDITGRAIDSQEAVKQFQRSKGLTDDGQAGQRTRRELVTAYMQLDGTTLPQGTVLQTHGCGEFHLAVPTADEVAEQQNRRVEVFFFENRIDPPPRPRCTAPGCPEYDQWRQRTVQTFDLEHPAGTLEVAVLDPQGRLITGAAVHVSGPTVADGQTDANGHVQLPDLIPGSYTVLGSRAGFRDGTAAATVDAPPASGGPPSTTTVQLQASTGDLVVTVRDGTGGAISGAQVVARDGTGAQVASAATDASGVVTFPALVAGSYSVGASAAGFGGQSATAQVQPNQSNALQITLQASPADLDVHVTSSVGGTNLSGVSVVLSGAASPPAGTTNAQGIAHFAALPLGSYTAALSLANFTSPSPAPAAQVRANQSNVLNVALTPAVGDLDVHVVDGTGAAVAAAEITVTPAGQAALAMVQTDAQGRSGFSAVPVGQSQVLVHKAGFSDASVAAAVQPGVQVVVNVTLQAATQTLAITTVDSGFAPGPESLQVTYNIAGLSGQTVKLRILADNYQGGKVFERDLTATELADGNAKTLQWDGSIDNGARNGRKAHPLLAPFKAELFHSATVKSEGPFNILYHSIVLDFGKHTPSGAMPDPATEQDAYVQARLNELGYDAGPVDGTATNAATKAALRRFQRCHYEVGTQNLLKESGTADLETLAALQDATARPIWETGKTPLTQDAKFYVYDNFLSDRGANFVTAPSSPPEFNSADRKKHAEDKMARAFIPLEVEVKLMGKGGGPVSAPDAVGPVTVAWEVNDGPEDAAIIPAADNATARTYVERARRFGNAAGSVGAAGRIDGDGDNAATAFQGFRDTDAAKYIKAWFPDDAANRLSPFAVRGYGNETRSGVVFQQAFVNAWDDANLHQQRRGRAGAYFRFSTKGGDDAKVRASISFDGLTNKAALEAAHASRANDLAKETGRWTVWRRSKLNAYCQQAVPTRAIGTPAWGTIRDRWAQAFIEMENSGNPEDTLTYSTTVTEAVFKAAILAMPAPQKPVSATDAAHIHYVASQMYAGPPMAPQLPGQTAQQYVNACTAAMTLWVKHPINAILGAIHGIVRRTRPEGFIIFDFRAHDPISGQDFNPVTGAFVPTANPAARNQTSVLAGYVRLDGAVTMCVDNPFNVNCYVMHECGHARFLYHHKVGGGGAGDAVATPHHHDLDQERCIMSYGINPDGPNAWDYRFCGKCILRLRGWDVLALPDQYTP